LSNNFHTNPFSQFGLWFSEAAKKGLKFPEACFLATIGQENFPEGRMVLMKSFDEKGFVFYTNLNSTKGRALRATSRAALTFYWEALSRQVRIQGNVMPVSNEAADDYFATRPRGSQLGAWASEQSELLESRAKLEEKFQQYDEKFTGCEIPRPPHWGGYRVSPHRIEFWIGRNDRLHDRLLYERNGETWVMQRLYP
tara:strand:- start:7491 stop:8081 length:591 start_codon:yes stop_codon:yes gene_type:complete